MFRRAAPRPLQEVLLRHRAVVMPDINAKDGAGATALHHAAVYGMVEVVQSLLEHGAARARGHHHGGPTGAQHCHVAQTDRERERE